MEQGRQFAAHDPELAERYRRQSEIELDPAYGEHLLVLKTELVGGGLGWPTLAASFPAGEQASSLEAGDKLLAEECRLLLKQRRRRVLLGA
jgi:hypothetical protein